jgi:hypothetical protein
MCELSFPRKRGSGAAAVVAIMVARLGDGRGQTQNFRCRSVFSCAVARTTASDFKKPEEYNQNAHIIATKHKF